MTRGQLVWFAVGAFLLGVLAVVAVLLIRGRERAQAPPPAPAAVAPAPAPPPPVATIRTRPEAEQLAAAFATAFGGPPPATRAVGEDEIIYRPARLRWIGERAVLVSAGTNRADCHACAGRLAIHYLASEAAGFRVTGAWLEGGGGADWGRPPDWSFSTLLSEQPIIRTDVGGGNQGVFCTRSRFYELSANGPREIADVQTGFSNMGNRVPDGGEPPVEVEGAIGNPVRGRSFDMVYTIRDYAQRGDEFVPAGRRHVTEHYVLRGGRYMRSTGESQIPEC